MMFEARHLNPSAPFDLEAGDVKRVAEQDIVAYQELIELFYGETSTIHRDDKHKSDHVARSLVLAHLLSSMYRKQGKSVDNRVVVLGVLFHDIYFAQHEHDDDHGERGAKIVESFLRNTVSKDVAIAVTSIVKWHNKRPEDVPSAVRTNEFDIVTTADALDLVRMEDGRAIRLVSKEGMKLRRVAQTFYKRTKDYKGKNQVQKVIAEAKEMGILVAPDNPV